MEVNEVNLSLYYGGVVVITIHYNGHDGIMVAMTYFVILESLQPIEINVNFSHDQNQFSLVVQQFSITHFWSSNSVDSWSKFLSGNYRERKLLT